MKKFLSVVTALILALSVCAAAQDAPALSSAPAAGRTVGAVEKTGEGFVIDAVCPAYSGFSGADRLNRFASDIVADGIGALNRAVIDNKAYVEEMRAKDGPTDLPEWECGFYTDFDDFRSGDLLSMTMLSYIYTGGAHGMSYKSALTVDMRTGEECTLESLFREGVDYRTLLTDKIVSEIEAHSDMYFEGAAKTVRDRGGDFLFYLDAGRLAVYFSLYDIAPYAAGMPHFYFEADTLRDQLKEDVRAALESTKGVPPVRIRYNGEDMPYIAGTDVYALGEQREITMVPLRLIAEKLGYEVAWTPETEAVVAGGQIRDGENNYFTSGKAPRKLSAAANVINGVTFVPIEYFSDLLGEDVTYYDGNVRIYKTGAEKNMFCELIQDYTAPASAEDCVKAYALALKMRNGAQQYALLDAALRDKKWDSFRESNWVTGVSSPWIKGYDVEKTSETQFKVTVYWQTSTGPAGTETLSVTTAGSDGNYHITAIE